MYIYNTLFLLYYYYYCYYYYYYSRGFAEQQKVRRQKIRFHGCLCIPHMQRTANCQQDLPRLWQILELVKQGHVGLRCEDELGSPGAVALWALSGSCCHVTTVSWKDTEPVYFLFHFFHFLHDMISHIKRSDCFEWNQVRLEALRG